MANKRPKPEEIVSKLHQVEVLMGQGVLSGQFEPVSTRTVMLPLMPRRDRATRPEQRFDSS